MNAIVRKVGPLLAAARVLVPLLFLALGVIAAMALFSAKELPPRVERTELATAVRTIVVAPSTVRLDVEAWGEVKASRTLALQPQVSGRILHIDAVLAPGAVLPAGSIVAQIEPRDFELALAQAQGALATAVFSLEVEQGRSRIAQRDWELLGDISGDLSLDAEAAALALRTPHLAEAQSAVETARTVVEQAQLALDRTTIALPFDAMVQARTAVDGSLVGPTSVLATLVGTDVWWVEVGVPMDDLVRVTFPDAQGAVGGEARIQVRLGDGLQATYAGRIERLIGTVDAAGRQARVLVQVNDPLQQAKGQAAPLLLGSYVSVVLEGPQRAGAFAIPRSVLRDGNVLWVLGADNRLAIRPANVLSGSLDTVVVDVDLNSDERIIASAVPSPLPGMLLTDEVGP